MADFNDDTDQEFNEAEDEANERARNAIQAKPVRFNYGIIMESDATENKQREMLDLCQIACEKFAPSEKPPKERDNQAAANMIKNTLDDKYDGPFNVIVGESFSLDVDYVQSTFFYMIFGGYLAIYIWKCV